MAGIASVAFSALLIVLGFARPAYAVSVCTTATAGADVTVTLVIGPDDSVDLAVDDDADADDLPGDSDDDDSVDISVNGGPFTECSPAVDLDDVDVVQVLGSNAGIEALRILQPADFGGANTVIDLGNGTDRLTLSYNAGSGSAAGDPGVGDTLELGTGAAGELVGDMDDDGAADLRIDDAELIGVDLGGLDDDAEAGCNDVPVCITGDSEASGASDDIPDAAAPFSQDLVVSGGAGNDEFQSGDGNDSYSAGAGVDEVEYDASSAAVSVDLSTAPGTATGMGSDTLVSVADVIGSIFNDTVVGSGVINLIRGIDGIDDIRGLAASDDLRGGAGDDFLRGNTGNDELRGGAGDDFLNGGTGTDLCNGGPGADVLVNCP